MAEQCLTTTGDSSLLAVRSSSSMEDLDAKNSGAGLYDSFIGVLPQLQNLKEAIENVFKSLFTLRAV